MHSNIKTKDMDLTDAVRAYVEEKLAPIARLLEEDEPEAFVDVEVGKSTRHHNKGPFMRAEMNLSAFGMLFRAEEEREDLYEAIDVCRDELKRQVAEHKDRARDEQRVPRPDKE